MEFTFTNKFNPEDHPNELGEALRNEFFNQDSGGFGCYSTFEVRPGVLFSGIYPTFMDREISVETRVYTKKVSGIEVTMQFWWDGDGTLEFHFPDGSYLYNGDCKKDYVWQYIGKES